MHAARDASQTRIAESGVDGGSAMPELPEITCRAREMRAALVGRTIVEVDVRQPKCLNVTACAFRKGLVGGKIRDVTPRGKWVITETSRGFFLLNLGMGGEVLLVSSERLPEKWKVRIGFDDGESLAINFWWFGHAHFAALDGLADHAPSAVLGPDALDVSLEGLRAALDGRRGRVKAFLLDQKRIAGIGNAYVHDILFRAHLHPLRPIPTLCDADVAALHRAIRDELERSIAKGGAYYELDLYGSPGGFTGDDLLVGYREGRPCPDCGTTIEKIRTGSTSSFVCPACQPIERP